MDRQPPTLPAPTPGSSARAAVDDAMRGRFRRQFGDPPADSLPTPLPGEVIPAVNASIGNYDNKLPPSPVAASPPLPPTPPPEPTPPPVPPLPPPIVSPSEPVLPPMPASPIPPLPPLIPPSPPRSGTSPEEHQGLKRVMTVLSVIVLLIAGGLWLNVNSKVREQAARLSAVEKKQESKQKLTVSQPKLDNLTVGSLKDGSNVALLDAEQSFTGANSFTNPGNRFVGDGSGLTGIATTVTYRNDYGTYNAYNTYNTTTVVDGGGSLPSNVTLQGNSFNSASQLVQLNGSGQLPALDGSLLTGITATTLSGQPGSYYLNASNLNAGIISSGLLPASVTLQGNAFNGASQLVQLTAGGLLPVLNGSNLTNIAAVTLNGQSGSFYQDATNINAGSLADGHLSGNVALYNAVTANFTGTLQNGGNNVCNASNNCNYASISGSANYIQNGTSPQTADFNVTGAGTVATLNATTQIRAGAGAGTQRIDASGNLVNIGNITTTGASTLSTGANTLTVTSSNFNVSSAGAIRLAGGQAPDITTAAATNANTITVQPGNSTQVGGGQAGANLTLQGGTSSGDTVPETDLFAGHVNIIGGTQTGNTAVGLQSGTWGGSVNITAGSATGTGNTHGGSVNINGGAGASAGSVFIGTANTSSLYVGYINVNSSQTISIGTNSGSGPTTLTVGSLIGSSTTTIRGGTGASAVSITSGVGTGAVASGGINITAGAASGSNGSTGGAITIKGGQGGGANNADAGGVTIQGGDTTGAFAGADGGSVTIRGGIASNASGGSVSIQAGAGDNNNATVTLQSPTINLNGSTLVSNAATVALLNTVTTTINFGGAASSGINIGSGSAGAIALQSGNTIALTSGTSLSLTSTGANAINITPGGTTNTGVVVKPGTDSTAAFKIQNAGSTATLLNADTSSLTVTVAGTTSTFGSLTLTNAHFQSTQTTAPTIGTPSNCGTSPSASITAGSTDSAGKLTITTGSGLPANCDTVITFNTAYAAAPKAILITPVETVMGTYNGYYISASTSSTFTVRFAATGGVGASKAHNFYYWVIE